MANKDMRPKPNNKAPNLVYTWFESCINSLGITSIKATYRNVPEARADSAAAPRPCAIPDMKYPMKMPMGEARVNGIMILQNLFILHDVSDTFFSFSIYRTILNK